MDLERMLEKCRRDQWSVGDIDWSQTPRPMSKQEEMTVVQLFTDMAGIERLAGALFVEQTRRVKLPVLKAIFETFVADEIRHAHAAQMLADHYDVHHYRIYRGSESLERFFPHFVSAVQHLNDDVANVYITIGELILDVALLRSINDYVHDELSDAVIQRINRDESRHIAIDYHMVEHYGTDAYVEDIKTRPARSLREEAAAFWAFANLLYRVKPFTRDVFFQPMAVIDPNGKRLIEAFKRFQLLRTKPAVRERPFGRFLLSMQDTANHPVWGPILGSVASRVIGTEPRFLKLLVSDEELREAAQKSCAELADEALAVKYSN